jgi:hypothetical protein
MADDDATPSERPLFIRELIRRVHRELLESRSEREEEGLEPIFEVQGMTIEVNFVAAESKEAKGGLDFRVITVGGSRQYDSQQVHKITLTLSAPVILVAEDDDEFGDLERSPGRFMPRQGG